MRTGILFVSKPMRSELAGSHPECMTRDFFLLRIQASSSLIASASPSFVFFAAAAASAASSSGESLREIRSPRGFESFSTGGMVIVTADRSAPSGAASTISFLHSSCSRPARSDQTQSDILSMCHQHAISIPAVCHKNAISMPSYRHQHAISMQSACHQIAIRLPSDCHQHAISIQSACTQDPIRGTHLLLVLRDQRDPTGDMLSLDAHLVSRAHVDRNLCLRPWLYDGIDARVFMHDEQPRARLVTRVSRRYDCKRRRVDGELRIGTCTERGRAVVSTCMQGQVSRCNQRELRIGTCTERGRAVVSTVCMLGPSRQSARP